MENSMKKILFLALILSAYCHLDAQSPSLSYSMPNSPPVPSPSELNGTSSNPNISFQVNENSDNGYPAFVINSKNAQNNDYIQWNIAGGTADNYTTSPLVSVTSQSGNTINTWNFTTAGTSFTQETPQGGYESLEL